MRKALLGLTLGLGALAAPASAFAAWSQGYVVDWYQMPSWQGGDKDVDCPNGNNPDPDWAKLLKTSWRTDAEVAKMTTNGALGYGTPLANRGPVPGQNVARDPTLVPNPHMTPVTGNISYGFDLDGDAKTGGFQSPDGSRKGVDNAVFRAVGCHSGFRGGSREKPRVAEFYEDNEMKSGVYTVLVMLSGDGKDPRNDPHVRVGFYLAKDPIVKDANGQVARDYSYRVDPDPRFTTVYDAASKNGVVAPLKPLKQLKIREYSGRANFPPDLILEKAQVAITMKQNGTIHADLGGYRDWRYLYAGWAAGYNANEISYKIDVTGMWYNLEQYADYKLPGAKGPNTHISSFYEMDAIPAFIVAPDNHSVVAKAEVFSGTSVAALDTPDAVTRRMRMIASDTGYKFEGGAAAWPNKDPALAAKLLADAKAAPADNQAWSKTITVKGGLLAIPPQATVTLDPKTASNAAKPAASVAPKPAASVAPKPAASATATKQPASYRP